MTEATGLTTEMLMILGILGLTVYLFISEVVRIDVAGLFILTLLGITSYLPGLTPLIEPAQLFSGFSGNAVISIIAVMIIGAGLDKTGIMSRVAAEILKRGDGKEPRLMSMVCGGVGFISSFMQNVGAAALFLPVVSRVSRRTGLPMSRLVMPMGFCAILGGTVTMIGSSPLILLNDLISSSNRSLPADQQMTEYGLFSVAPIGIALTLVGIIYFVIGARFVLPGSASDSQRTSRTSDYFKSVYKISGELVEARVTDESPMLGMTIEQVAEHYPDLPFVVALYNGEVIKVPPALDETFWVNTVVGLMGDREQIEQFCSEHHWEVRGEPDRFADVLNAQYSGIAELVIPPGSSLIGKAISEIKPRRNYGTNILQIYRYDTVIEKNFSDTVMRAGDTLVVHAAWKDVHKLSSNNDFAVVNDHRPEELRPEKVRYALIFFGLALVLALFTNMMLSLALLVGAIGMILSGVLSMDEAYESVSWSSVFLLASLIPLGIAVDDTGTAAWIAAHTLDLLEGMPVWVLQTVVALLGTFFSLVMSNVGATVLLVPLAVNIAIGAGADPALFALTVAISTNNSFLIPTHQVNALLMGPGGYNVHDFIRAGGIMTVLYLLVSLFMLNLFY